MGRQDTMPSPEARPAPPGTAGSGPASGGHLKHQKIAAALRAQITSGTLTPGTRVPAIADLCARHGCARDTCGKALRELERAGLITLAPGQGYHVAGASGEHAKYRQIAAAIRDQITSGTLPPGSRLPAASTLASQHGCNLHTCAKALAMLEREGLAAFVPGHGHYVPGPGLPRQSRTSRQVAAALRDQITSGTLPLGTPVSLTGLSSQHGCAWATCERAMAVLERDGLVSRVPGHGYHVAGAPRPPGNAQRAQQIAAALRDQVTSGTLPPGTRLPAAAGLARSCQCKPHVIRAALRILRAEGLITLAYSMPGPGGKHEVTGHAGTGQAKRA
jgi:DNA-binding GntR family transcriptional regulator